MVSGRCKAYEKEDRPEDSLAKDTSMATFKLELAIRDDAKVNKKQITVEGETFSRKAIDDFADDIRSGKSNPQPINWYEGKSVCVVDAGKKEYVALMRLKRMGSCRRLIVYDPADKKVKEALLRVTTAALEQDGPDDRYLDDITKSIEETK